MKIKVCGLKDPGNINEVASLSPDYMGFICYDQSPRYVDELSADVLHGLSAHKTGVFVDETFGNVVDKINEYDLDAVQLHGMEGTWMCDALKNKKAIAITNVTIVTKGGRELKKQREEATSVVKPDKAVTVIKAFGVDEFFDFNQLNAYADVVDYFLFDTKTPKHGGSGTAFNWDVLQKYNLNVPFFLSGGLSLDNLAEVQKIKHPMFYGVDLNSRFETAPGIKDIELLKKAFKLLRQPDIQ